MKKEQEQRIQQVADILASLLNDGVSVKQINNSLGKCTPLNGLNMGTFLAPFMRTGTVSEPAQPNLIRVRVQKTEPAQPNVMRVVRVQRTESQERQSKEPMNFSSGRPTAFEQVKAQEKPIQI